jgi:ABC-type nitrate/sulfonate/bicarbonate transport system ATPase subunit
MTSIFKQSSVLENVMTGTFLRGKTHAAAQEDSLEVLDLVGLYELKSTLGKSLTIADRKRLELARALANKPEVLLMDEPFASVDAQTRELLQEELLKIWGEELPTNKRKLVLFVTHSIDEAVFLSDVVFVMTARPGAIKEVFRNSYFPWLAFLEKAVKLILEKTEKPEELVDVIIHGARDMGSRVWNGHTIYFAGEMSWGDEPQGCGYQALKWIELLNADRTRNVPARTPS